MRAAWDSFTAGSGDSSLAKASLAITTGGVVIAALQLVHQVYGVGVAPITVGWEIVREFTGGVPTSGAPGEIPVGSGSSGDPSQILEDAMKDGIEDISDSIPPTSPSNLRVTAQDECVVTLAWDPSTDDKELSGYRIYDRGSVRGMVAEGTTEFVDRLVPGTATSFTVVAFDRSLNESERSNEVAASCGVTSDTAGGEMSSSPTTTP